MSESEHCDSEFYYPGELSGAEMLQLPTHSEATERKLLLSKRSNATAHGLVPPKNENEKKWSYVKMLIDWVRSGRTGKYLALGQNARTSLRLVRTSWPRAKYFPVRPSHLFNKYIQEIIKVLTLIISWYIVFFRLHA